MIIRRRHTANFTTIGNAVFDDDVLAADEVGVLAYLLSRPNDWEVRRPALQRRWRVGRDSIKRIMLALIQAGWIVARKTRLSNGTFHVIYEVRDEPGPKLTEDQAKAATSLVSSDAEEAEDGEQKGQPPETGDPPTGQPDTAQPDTANPSWSYKKGLLNTDSQNTESPNSGCAFSDILEEWPSEHTLSKVASQTAFSLMTGTLQTRALDGIKPYLDDCKASARKICDLTTYLREQRFERVIEKTTTKALFACQRGTPQAARWREYFLRAAPNRLRGFDQAMSEGRAYTTLSEWPPALPPKAPDRPVTSPPSNPLMTEEDLNTEL